MEPFKPEPELQQFYHQLLHPLSIFPSRKTYAEPPKRLPQEVPMLPSLPVSRLTVASLCSQVSKRLARCELEEQMPPAGPLRFRKVILDELKCSWREPPPEPSLSHFNNQRLRKRVLVYVLLSCEQLFLHYLRLLKTMPTSTHVFTESATLTRLAANLARDCTIFLTSPEVYRGLLADFRSLLRVQQAQDGIVQLRPFGPPAASKPPRPHGASSAQIPHCNLNLSYLIQLSRSRELLSEPRPDPVKELKSIPQLKKKTLRWLPAMQKKGESFTSSQTESLPRYSMAVTSRSPRTSYLPLYAHLHRGRSMPSLREGWKLADELGLPPLLPRPLTPLVLFAESKPELVEDMVAEDLKQIMKNMKLERTRYAPMDSGVSPLLGALTHHPATAHRIEELQRMLNEEEETSGQWGPQLPKPPPLHPQPVTVTLKLRNQIMVQAAGVQVSKRKFLDSFHVEETGALYNHLVGELDSKQIEEMDIDRFIGNSIREVYKELMSRVSLDHFSFDQGPLIEPAASKDWSMFLSSAFLHQDKRHRVINPKLVGLCPKRVITFQSSLSLFQVSKSWERRPKKTSGMNWLKNISCLGDYFKYLTNQETDFLHVIFQMYEEDVPVEIVPPVRESLKFQHPPPLLEDEEPDFVPGEWDWNTVLGHSLETRRASLLGEPHKIPSLQKRLQRLWSILEVPDKNRMDMAIKYSSNARLRQLPLLLSAWEQTVQPIQLREILLGKLEWFERHASDPNRFFQKTGMDLTRLLEENQIRNHLHRKLNLMEAPLVSLLEEVEVIFGEPVTFKGRRYLDKMKLDKVEMLYWLQQRRRMHQLVGTQKASHQSAMFQRLSMKPLIAPRNTPSPSDR
ncbi:Coiled-coil domain-containing protein 87 [Myotis brandtii]|uniref:Coiled-coil domain-containing protein 87 n=1 Tax=Myotis brandtii TaxID=109478 RepID=S7MQJ6_MYOBR|nr:PREDICTED: coiled-coil domain-containing protein 87 [Myotis brandtii]EPQ06576.1 Coiled-coil domain-containing protein 87 [Myotis brandtii]